MELFQELIASAQKQNLHVLNVVVRQKGRIVGRQDFVPEAPHLLWSASKAFTAMAVGIAAGEGLLSLGDSMTGFFREMGYRPDPAFDLITVRDLLRMGTGQLHCPIDQAMREGRPFSDLCALFFEELPAGAPGSRFVYNNGATYMLSRIVEHVAGKNLRDYLVPRLFMPLGIGNPRWDFCPMGHPQGFSGLWLTASELSRMGQLLLDGGSWKGSQLIPAGYVRDAMSPQISTADFDAPFATADHRQGYGYQLWQNSYPGSCRLDGMYGQYVVILPDRNAVVTYVSDEPEKMTAILELTWNTLLDKL